MPSPESYREALERMSEADRARRKAFHEIGSWRSGDKEGVAKARKLLDEFKSESRRLETQYIRPLEKRFLSGDPEATDEVIAVLSVDALSYRSGYRKEDYYRRLKKTALSDEQISRLKSIALKRCASSEYRREDTELRKLMVKLADLEFLNKVEEIPARQDSLADRHKKRMLEVILHGRKDLRNEAKALSKGRTKSA
jgi:hypothetical protein